MKEIRQIIQAFEKAVKEQKKAVLATVVHIEGSSYRAPGARMLITEDGQLTGAVSGGCLEGDVLRKALLVMMEEKPMLVTYDTSDDEGDSVIGINLGCNGVIRILLEPLSPNKEQTPITLLQKATDHRKPAVVVTFFNTAETKQELQGTRLTYSDNNFFIADTGLPIEQRKMLGDLHRVLAGKDSLFVEYSQTSKGNGALTAFMEYISPMPAIIVAGAGNDVQPLAQMAGVLGWDISLIDGRKSYANEERFPGCQVMISSPEAALQKMVIDEQTAVLLMSHNYDYDKAILTQAIKTVTPYIGILGPTKKTDKLLAELKADGVEISAEQEARVFGPVGFDIGAETSEEIALSILAEIKAVFENRHGGSLRKQEGKIHHRSTGIVPSMQSYGVLLLAAGKSQRLGTPKQELIYNGDTLLRNSVHAALELNTAVTTVVVNDQADEIVAQLDNLPVDIVVNEQYTEGMASSIREGYRHIKESYPQVQFILVMLCDQPFVDAAHLRSLIETQQSTGASVVASYYDGRKGVPALFHQKLFPQLEILEGDTGAKHVIENLGDAVAIVDFPQGAIDVDTKENYQQISKLTTAPFNK